MKKALSLIFVIMTAGMIVCFFNLKSEGLKLQKPESPALVPAILTIEENIPDIMIDIRKAQNMLKKEDAGSSVTERKKKGQWEVKDLQILLAVRHVDGNIKIISVDPKAKRVDQSGYTIDWSKPNGVNTVFSIIHPQGCEVLALKRVVKDQDELFKEVVYTPYSDKIDCSELRKAGLTYLKTVIQEARRQLTQVPSSAYDGQSVAETTSEDLAFVLAIIEHIDPDRLLRKEPIEKLINEVLVVIGANQSHAYRYAVSKANARGLFQFIPRTYKLICDKYGDAKLHDDFVEGMNDHLNAAKASLLLFDSDLSYLKGQKINAKSDLVLGKHLASAYNYGAERTAKTIKKHKDFWERKVPKETRLYLKKFTVVWDLLINA